MDTTLIQSRLDNLIDDGLPLTYTFAGIDYTAASCVVYQKLRFSEWGVENGYSQSILIKMSDFVTTDPPDEGDIVVLDGVNLRVLSADSDASRTGKMLNLGAEYHAE